MQSAGTANKVGDDDSLVRHVWFLRINKTIPRPPHGTTSPDRTHHRCLVFSSRSLSSPVLITRRSASRMSPITCPSFHGPSLLSVVSSHLQLSFPLPRHAPPLLSCVDVVCFLFCLSQTVCLWMRGGKRWTSLKKTATRGFSFWRLNCLSLSPLHFWSTTRLLYGNRFFF